MFDEIFVVNALYSEVMANGGRGHAGRALVEKHSSRQWQKDATKARLVDAAIELFERKGFVSVSVDDIAKAAGVARTTFYLYFPAKIDLANEIGLSVFELHAEHFRTLAHLPATEASARRWLRTHLDLISRNSARIDVSTQANVSDPKLGQDLWDVYEELAVEILGSRGAMPPRELAKAVGRVRGLLMMLDRFAFLTQVQGVHPVRAAEEGVVWYITQLAEYIQSISEDGTGVTAPRLN